jgi:hypothetical protein
VRLSTSILFAGLLAGLLAGAATSSGCFDRPRPACAFWCGDDGACPDGYRCATDQWCKREDVAETFACGPGPDQDAAPPAIDAARPDATTPAIDAATPSIDAATPSIDAATPAIDAAAPPDAAPPDAAPPDAASPDANAAALR